PINQFLRQYGFIQQNIPWLSDPTLAKITIIMVNLWLGFPYFMALTSSVMTGIDPTLYEAAEIDGATGKQSFWHITLPLVLYSTAPLLIMSFAHNFNNFNVIYFLTEGNPINPSYKFAGHTDIFITWIYKLTMNNKQFNMASVMSILIFLIVGSISAWNFLNTQSFKEEDIV
ncbi:MAG TPA: sugar ABC transporter permease, partial [Clostridiales bacterium]|nr:sugar ABC transporter permease [Clostridiales bacterium]